MHQLHVAHLLLPRVDLYEISHPTLHPIILCDGSGEYHRLCNISIGDALPGSAVFSAETVWQPFGSRFGLSVFGLRPTFRPDRPGPAELVPPLRSARRRQRRCAPWLEVPLRSTCRFLTTM